MGARRTDSLLPAQMSPEQKDLYEAIAHGPGLKGRSISP